MQVAAQQGQYLAKLLAKNGVPEVEQLPQGTKPFKYGHKGSLAYVGQVSTQVARIVHAIPEAKHCSAKPCETAAVVWRHA